VSAVRYAVALFFLSPLVGEYLLGNLPVSALPLLLLMAPLYGGGALLVRETARRTGRGWPAILVLALAYGVAEEGLVSHSLFNPGYAGHELHQYAPLPLLGMGGWWTVFVLTLHTIGSIATPIALVELFAGDRAEAPWLGRRGLAVATALFLAGAGTLAALTIQEVGFVPSAGQLAGAAAATVALAVLALRLPRQAPAAAGDAPPSPRTVAAAAVLAGLLFMAGAALADLDWLVVTAWLALWFTGVRLVLTWSRRPGWSPRHRLALAVGPLATYGWFSLLSAPMLTTSAWVDRMGDVLFVSLAIAVVATAYRGVTRTPVPRP
jgi:hypothetical protein